MPLPARIATLMAMGLLVSCKGAAGECAPGEFTVSAHGDRQLNLAPAPEREALPTQLRIYQLADSASLEGASFEDIWHRADEVLSEDILNAENHVVYPGEEIQVRMPREAEARYLAAVALFRRPSGIAWQAVYRMPPLPTCGKGTRKPSPDLHFHVYLKDYEVFISQTPPRPAPPMPGGKDQSTELKS